MQTRLPEGWQRVELAFEAGSPAHAERAASLLAPAQPFRATPTTLRFASSRDGHAPGPDAVTRLLRRLDEARVGGRLELAGSHVPEPAAEQATTLLADGWRMALAELPPDWSDLYAEVRFDSSDYIEPGAVLCAPLNPRRDGSRSALRFRSARRAGYGASPEMVARCFARCDEAGFGGAVEILRVLSDTRLVATQGPTWLVAGRNI
jgi:hypothetical protein